MSDLTPAQQKLAKHRQRAMNNGVTPADYSKDIGLAPQRIAALCKPGARAPTLEEARLFTQKMKIKPYDWLA